MHFLLLYDLAPDYMERRGEFRDKHLAHAWQAQGRGELVLAGALADPADTAVLLFEAESPDVAERFAAADPYVQNGLVSSYRVRAWTTVVGDAAATPVVPNG
ncbi:MAG TPA: YciI-like protein [Thermomicrobiales bacterium]|nr:YciI-like protein [Thermomicrobiales bacterium]